MHPTPNNTATNVLAAHSIGLQDYIKARKQPIHTTHHIMPPKAEKKPTTAGKAPAGKAPAEKKEAGKKTAAPAGDKKKRSKTRKETYSSYIYKGIVLLC